MRAKLFVNLPVLSLGKKMEIDLAQDRAVTVWVAHHQFRSVPTRDAKMIIEIAGCLWQRRAKKTVPMDLLRRDRLRFCLSIYHNVDLLCVRAEGATNEA